MKTMFLGMMIAAHMVNSRTPDPYFTTIRAENGLSNNKVNCILQDKRGFIWFGTEDGLNRYDGKSFTVFRSSPTDTTTLSGNRITDILEDKAGIFWIATADGGLTKYDYRLAQSLQFKRFRHSETVPGSIPENHINKLVDDQRGNLWLATSSSRVVRFNKKTERFDIPVNTGTRGILSLMLDQDGVLWVGREGGGLLKINTRTLAYETDARYKNLYAKLPHASISAIYKSSDQSVWFGSWDKVLYRYDCRKSAKEAFSHTSNPASFPDDEIVSFAEAGNRQLWMASRQSGLIVYDPNRNRFTTYRNDPLKKGTLVDNHVNAVYIDRSGIVWACTNNGVSKYNPLYSPFRRICLPKGPTDITIYDFYKDEQQRLWIGTNEGIFVTSDQGQSFEKRTVVYKGQPLAVTKFFKDVDNTLYVGTDYTLFVYNPVTNTVAPLPNTEADPVMKKLIASRVVSVVRDTLNAHPVLLVSPYGHYLTYYDLVDKVWVSRMDSVRKIIDRYSLKDNLIRKLYKSKAGVMWLATARYGLGNWPQPGKHPVSYFRNSPANAYPISCDDVYDIQEDRKGQLWVSTYGGGVNHFNPRTGKFRHIRESSNLTEGLQIDSRNNVWMICNGHVHKYDNALRTYSCYDLPALKSESGLKGYIYKDSRDTMYAAGINYYVVFNPKTISRITKEPPVYLTDFKIFTDSKPDLLTNKSVELTYQQNYFSIEFSAPEFSGDNLQYAFMMEGLDTKWTDAGKNTVASYSNLKAGQYRFLVRASNWRGSFGSRITELRIRINPPFWQTWWFCMLSSLIFLIMVYAIYKYRIKQVYEKQAIRNEIARDLHDHIGSTLSSISIYSRVASIYQDQQQAQELRQLLTTIGETSNEMITEMADIVWAIKPTDDRMTSIVKRIESYARPLCAAKNIHFDMAVDPRINTLNLGMVVRKNIYLIVKEAINNALKYAHCVRLAVSIRLKNNRLELVVQDNGVGYNLNEVLESSAQSLSGNGLQNMSRRAQEMQAPFLIDSVIGQGTRIKLSINIT
ncbi:histidine kinase [Fibrisoma limi BUZ 3]|uniref:Histidine kinase n=1 Tax=Fibrisoma limi BUZ 3 TaxID=1185876 RepID=I2GK19_9BACT|nr:sensor histidine kinase [Fibrisoma limi]CCH54244.1 histidine kinase [Fibrisoma limi BUZ 3]